MSKYHFNKETKTQKNEIESYRSREKEILLEENRSIFRELKVILIKLK